jgi:hypothetical protein
VQNGAVELLLDFIDGGDPSETLESAGYRVQAELAYALLQMDEPLAAGEKIRLTMPSQLTSISSFNKWSIRRCRHL